MNMINRALPDVRQELMRIAGRKVSGDTCKTLDVHYPYTNQVIGTVPRASRAQVAEAFAIGAAYTSLN